jgi:hypothetical protein
VPIVERVSHQQEPEEFCVINIDTLDDRYPLLTTETEALLKLLSDIVAVGYRVHGDRRLGEQRPSISA